MNNLYEEDFCVWADQQAALLKAGRLDQLDLTNLIEEVEDMGNRHRDAVESQLERLMMHIIKWKIQPQKRSHSWVYSIANARHEIQKKQRKYPSLNDNFLKTIWEECLCDATKGAEIETGLKSSVEDLSWQEVFEEDYFLDEF